MRKSRGESGEPYLAIQGEMGAEVGQRGESDPFRIARLRPRLATLRPEKSLTHQCLSSAPACQMWACKERSFVWMQGLAPLGPAGGINDPKEALRALRWGTCPLWER